MRVLLDTELLLWAASEPKRLPAATRRIIEDPHNQPVFSAASLWEVSIKSGLGRADFRADARVLRRGLLDNGYEELAITDEHAVAIGNLPPIHNKTSETDDTSLGHCRTDHPERLDRDRAIGIEEAARIAPP